MSTTSPKTNSDANKNANKNANENATDDTSSSYKQFVPYILAIVAICGYAAAFYTTSRFIGDTESWKSLKGQLNTILISCMIGTVILFVASFLYFQQNQEYMMYFLLFLTFTTLCLSYAALCVSAISS